MGVCMCGFCKLWVFVRLGFVMSGSVSVAFVLCVFCVCLGFVI